MNTALGALANGSIASAILAAAIVVLTSTPIWNAASRYVIWWAALFASVTLTIVYFSADAFHAAPRSVGVQNPLPRTTVVLPAQSAGPLSAPQGSPVFTGPGITPSLPIRVSAGSVLRWVGLAWMLTSALMLVRLIVSYQVIERRKAAAVPIGSDRDGRLRELFRRAGVTRSIRIAVSDEIRGPIATGPHRPAVLIPATLIRELDAFELDQVVLHEAAHLIRRDDYAVFIQRLIQALLVFHPVVHWISRRIDIEREIACDDFVVLATGKARPYASCLTRVAELCGCVAASPLAASAAGSRSALVRRIEELLDDRRKASSRPMKARLVLAATAILAVTGAGIVAATTGCVSCGRQRCRSRTAIAGAARGRPDCCYQCKCVYPIASGLAHAAQPAGFDGDGKCSSRGDRAFAPLCQRTSKREFQDSGTGCGAKHHELLWGRAWGRAGISLHCPEYQWSQSR